MGIWSKVARVREVIFVVKQANKNMTSIVHWDGEEQGTISPFFFLPPSYLSRPVTRRTNSCNECCYRSRNARHNINTIYFINIVSFSHYISVSFWQIALILVSFKRELSALQCGVHNSNSTTWDLSRRIGTTSLIYFCFDQFLLL